MIIKTFHDKEKAKSILKMAKESEEYLKELFSERTIKKYQSIAAREYYDIIRSLATALLLCRGFKAVGENAHKETIDFLSNFNDLSVAEIDKMQDLRIRINQNSYEGKPIESPYLENNKDKLDKIVSKLKSVLIKEIG